MSHPGFVITPYDPSDEAESKAALDHELDFDDLSEKLKTRWLSASLSIKSTPVFEWINTDGIPQLKTTNRTQDVFTCIIPSDEDLNSLPVHITHLTASFGGFPRELVVEFILWFRNYLPSKIPLYLFAENPDDSLQLTISTTKTQIENYVFHN